MTQATGPYSQHLFLPLKKELAPVFFREDIEYKDSADGFVCYIIPGSDSAQKNITWAVENLISRKREYFRTEIGGDAVGYPWYQSIYRNKEELIIEIDDKNQKRIPIEKYCD